MSPLNDYRSTMNSMYDNEPVRIVVSTQFLIKMGLAGFLVSRRPHSNSTAATATPALLLPAADVRCCAVCCV